jgi:DNA (cytosine-5)-methyltransferase 1
VSIPFKEFGTNEIGELITSDYTLKLLKNEITKTGSLQAYKKSMNGALGAVGFNYVCKENQTPLTITSKEQKPIHFNLTNYITNEAIQQIGSYPLDYNFKSIEPKYLIGMSVPPVMMAQISHQIYLQWFANHG